jgi:hypothetical protein
MLVGRGTWDVGRKACYHGSSHVPRPTSNVQRSLIFTVLFFLLGSAIAHAAEPYFITIQKLELRQRNGEWVTIVKPDHQVDLMSSDAAVSFFNNGGRVPEGDYDNFKLTFADHATEREITRKLNYDQPLPVRNGSFIRVWFVLDFERDANQTAIRPSGIHELRLTVDDIIRIDDARTLDF